MEGALDRFIAWDERSPFNRAVVWYVLGMVMGLVFEWEGDWYSPEQTFQSMIAVGLICASISLVWSFAKFALATATLRLLEPGDELVSGGISAPSEQTGGPASELGHRGPSPPGPPS